MAVVNTSTFNFREVVNQYLNQGYKDVVEAVEESVDEVSKEAVKKLKQESTAKFGNGPYAKGWTRTPGRGRFNTLWTVHGLKPTYSLAHLLENGHAKRGGGRTNSFVHIEPVEQWAVDEALDRVVRKMERRTI